MGSVRCALTVLSRRCYGRVAIDPAHAQPKDQALMEGFSSAYQNGKVQQLVIILITRMASSTFFLNHLHDIQDILKQEIT